MINLKLTLQLSVFLMVFTSPFMVLLAQDEGNHFELYFTLVQDRTRGDYEWGGEDIRSDSEFVALYLSSFELKNNQIQHLSKPKLLWKKEAVQITLNRFFADANIFLFRTRSDPDILKINWADKSHFFDIRSPLKLYAIREESNGRVFSKIQNRTTLLTWFFDDSLLLKSYTSSNLNGIVEKDSMIWIKNGYPYFVRLEPEGYLYTEGCAMGNIKLPVRLDPALLLQNSISDTCFLILYQNENWLVMKPSKTQNSSEDWAWGKEVIVYNKQSQQWTAYSLEMKFPRGNVIGDYYIMYDEYHIDGRKIYFNVNIINMKTGDIQWVDFPVNTKIIAIQGSLWILTMPGRLMFLQKKGTQFKKIGVIYREDAEKITFAWIKKSTQKVSPVK